MRAFIGLDPSLNSVAICVVDGEGAVICEGKMEGHPEAVLKVLEPWRERVGRIGLEAGPTSEWIGGRLMAAGLPVICMETRHVKAAFSAMVPKTDRGDARGIAQIVCAGWFTAVHRKSPESQRRRTLTAARQFLVRGVTATEQAIRGVPRPFGLEVGPVTRRRFADRVRALVGDDPALRPRSPRRCSARTSASSPRLRACTGWCFRPCAPILSAGG